MHDKHARSSFPLTWHTHTHTHIHVCASDLSSSASLSLSLSLSRVPVPRAPYHREHLLSLSLARSGYYFWTRQWRIDDKLDVCRRRRKRARASELSDFLFWRRQRGKREGVGVGGDSSGIFFFFLSFFFFILFWGVRERCRARSLEQVLNWREVRCAQRWRMRERERVVRERTISVVLILFG